MIGKSITQRPTPPNEWLYWQEDENTRIFTDYVIRNEQSPAWNECTNEEKEQWEQEHPKPEPPQPEPEV